MVNQKKEDERCVISIYITPEEYDKIREAMNNCYARVISDYCRAAVLTKVHQDLRGEKNEN